MHSPAANQCMTSPGQTIKILEFSDVVLPPCNYRHYAVLFLVKETSGPPGQHFWISLSSPGAHPFDI